jgi:hypothetical protein
MIVGVARLFGTMNVTRLYGTMVGVAGLEIDLPSTLNTMYIGYASKSTSCMGDPSPPITTNYVS